MALPQSWGDSLTLKTMSIAFGLRLTVLNAVSLTENRIRHDKELGDTDLVLVYNGYNHYSAASKSILHVMTLKLHVITNLCTLSSTNAR